MKYAFLFITFMITLLSSSSQAAEPAKMVFPNGLTLIVKEAVQSDIIAFTVFVRAGAFNDSEKKAGLAYFTQSMLLQGTTSKSAEDIALLTESIGASIHGNCAEDYITLSAVVFKKYFPQTLDIFFDVLLHPAFSEKEIEKEKATTLAEIKSRHDHIFNVAFDELLETMYGRHPYHRPVIGYETTVKQFQRDDLIAFYRSHFTPENMVMTIVGDIEEAEIKTFLKIFFPDLETPSMVRSNSIEKAIELPDEGKREIAKPASFGQGYLMVGYSVPPVSSPDYAVLKLINGILSGGMNSRLFLFLREKEGLGYEVNSFYPSRVDTSSFVIYLGLAHDSLTKALQLIEQEIKKLKEEKVSADELMKVKTYLSGAYKLTRQKNQDYAFYLGFYEILGKGFGYDAVYTQDLQKVTAEDIQRVATKYFTDNNFTVIKLLPKEMEAQ